MSRFILPFQSVYDLNGHPLDGAKLYFYETGTSTPKDTYSDQALSVANANPVIADNAGEFDNIFMTGIYRVELQDKDGVTQPNYPADNVPAGAAGVYETVAAMKLVSIDAGSWVQTNGYYAAGDGGHGAYWIDTLANHGAADGFGDHALANTNVAVLQNDGRLNVRQYGAKGDGVTNDTLTFQAAAAAINAEGGGEIIIPSGTYVVLSESINPSPSSGSPYYVSGGHVLEFTNCNGLRIVFEGATLLGEAGLHYGSFDPLTGAVHNATPGGFTDVAYQASPQDVITHTNCKNVEIINAIIDSNLDEFVEGGYWGDVGIQISQVGIRIYNSENVKVTNAKVSYCGLDGLYVRGTADQRVNVSFENCISEYNGRQGLSWTGGSGLTATNCVFQKTGQGGISSAPGAGVDIEDNGDGCFDGLFQNCQFLDTIGITLISINTTDRIKFDRCVFSATDGGRALWPASKGLTFENCTSHGSIVNTFSDTVFSNCRLTNELFKDQTVMYQKFLDVNNTTIFRDCIIDCYSVLGSNFNVRGGAKLFDCRFLMSQTDPAQRFTVGDVGAANFIDCSFEQNYTFDVEPSTDIEISDEHTLISTSSPILFGRNIITGAGLAWSSRAGDVNKILNVLKQVQYTDEFNVTLLGAGPTFDVDVGYGNRIIQLYKTTGNSILRYVSATWLATSSFSSAGERHVYNKLVSKENDFGEGGSVDMIQSGSTDSIRFTEGTIALDTEVWTIRSISLSALHLDIL